MTPGSYDFTFECALLRLPTSFEGEYGHIRYTACVVLDIPMWPDKEFEVAFTVIKPINLNDDPHLRVISSIHSQRRKMIFDVINVLLSILGTGNR